MPYCETILTSDHERFQLAKLTHTEHCGTNCPLRTALSLLEGKYTVHILREFLAGTQRFNKLLRSIPGISRRTLSEKLKYLTDVGMVSRRVYAEIPPRVEYQLTSQGESLKEVIGKLETLGSMVEEKIEIAKMEDAPNEPVGRFHRCGMGESVHPLRQPAR